MGPASGPDADHQRTCVPGTGEINAVLDWELSTLGDPLADLGLLLVYWPQPGDELPAGTPDASLASGFPTRDELVTRYADRSGRDVANVGFYVALGSWKLAIIMQGVYARLLAHNRGHGEPWVKQVAALVQHTAQAAMNAIEEPGRT
jgi:aminoglycoside phosphotransferase (APT) family kinase protein